MNNPSLENQKNLKSFKRHFGFLLANNFSMIAYASALEPLRLANRVSQKTNYSWEIIGETEEVTCSNGTIIKTNTQLPELPRDTTIIVVGGAEIKSNTTKAIQNWLRREARKGSVIGAICTASYILAKAGLLENKKVTIHWENRDSFVEDFPEIELTSSIFTIDGNRFSAAGGTASADLMLKLISEDLGSEIANLVADQLIHTSIRTDRDEQRLSIPTRIGVRHPKLSRVISIMENNIEEPVSPSDLSQEVGMSTRQLERLFRRYLNRSPKRYYMQLRLQRARNLLMQTDMSVINVALACGFTSPSHFSKCYRAQYNTTPYRERGSNSST